MTISDTRDDFTRLLLGDDGSTDPTVDVAGYRRRPRGVDGMGMVLGVLRGARPVSLDLVELCSATALARESLREAVLQLEEQHLVEEDFGRGERVRYRAR
jgi:hypothetical protein